MQLLPFVTPSLAAQTMTGVISVNTFHMTSPRGRNRCPHLRENEPTRSRQGSSKQQQQQQVQVQVLLRPTGDFFCLTQFQNQYPELDPGLRLSPVSLPGEGRAPRAAHAAAGAARPFPAPVGLSMAMHMHVRARVYARGWTSAGRGGNPNAAGSIRLGQNPARLHQWPLPFVLLFSKLEIYFTDLTECSKSKQARPGSCFRSPRAQTSAVRSNTRGPANKQVQSRFKGWVP